MGKLNNTHLNNQWVKEEITREVKKKKRIIILTQTKKETQQAKAVLTGKFKATDASLRKKRQRAS